jgi:hypothetical protein
MEEKEDNIWTKIQNIPREILYILLIISMVIPLLSPLGLPLPITAQTRTLYESLLTLEEGDVMLLFVDWGAGSISIHQPGALAVSVQAIQQGAKLVYLTTNTEGPLMYERLLNEKLQPILDNAGYEYGEDYVFLGYVAGAETALAAIASNIRTAYSDDYYRTPLDDIPLMQTVQNHADFDMIITFTMGSPESFVRQFNTQYGVVTHVHCGEMMTPNLLPFWASGQITGLLNGAFGAAELEVLIQRPGDAVKLTDVYSFANILVFVFLVMGNIGYMMIGRRE